ncbi:AIG2-like protein [Xylaria cf. heliscus]|nr:AIG2-like protein [Xylaria cf. heliscus]
MAHQTPKIVMDSRKREPVSPRPLFIYGSLCALPLLACVLTGDAKNTAAVTGLIQPARVNGYARFTVQSGDDAAAVKHPRSSVDGYLLRLETMSQRRKLDNFEGDSYKPVPVEAVTDIQADPEIPTTLIEADMYMWTGDMNLVSSSPWLIETFEKERLQYWLETLEGMEIIDRNQREAQDGLSVTRKA